MIRSSNNINGVECNLDPMSLLYEGKPGEKVRILKSNSPTEIFDGRIFAASTEWKAFMGDATWIANNAVSANITGTTQQTLNALGVTVFNLVTLGWGPGIGVVLTTKSNEITGVQGSPVTINTALSAIQNVITRFFQINPCWFNSTSVMRYTTQQLSAATAQFACLDFLTTIFFNQFVPQFAALYTAGGVILPQLITANGQPGDVVGVQNLDAIMLGGFYQTDEFEQKAAASLSYVTIKALLPDLRGLLDYKLAERDTNAHRAPNELVASTVPSAMKKRINTLMGKGLDPAYKTSRFDMGANSSPSSQPAMNLSKTAATDMNYAGRQIQNAADQGGAAINEVMRKVGQLDPHLLNALLQTRR